jgi:hypothetical protein
MNSKANKLKVKKGEKSKLYGTKKFTVAQENLENIMKKISPYTDRKNVFYVPKLSEWCDESCNNIVNI